MGAVWVLTDERYLDQRMPSALINSLRQRGAPVRVLVSERLIAEVDADPGSPERNPWAALDQSDIVVARTRNRFGLALLRAAEQHDVRVLTPWAAIAAVRNKPRAAQVLAGCGIPAPRTFFADNPGALSKLPERCFPLVLKPHLGDNAQGIVIVGHPTELDDLTWSDGMVLAQQFVDVKGVDLKLYVAREQVWAVRRPSPLGLCAGRAVAGCESVVLTPALRNLARSCGLAFGLTLYGVDVLESASGPLVIDVNDFPNYTGVPHAPGGIAESVIELLPRKVSA